MVQKSQTKEPACKMDLLCPITFLCTTTDAAFNRLEAFPLRSQVPSADVTASYMTV